MLVELRDLSSRSKLFCFFNICIFRTRSLNVSVRRMVKSSCGSLVWFGGSGGRRNVYDSSTCGISNVVVCLRLGRGILISTSAPSPPPPLLLTTIVFWLSSNSGVDVHDDGRFGLTATHLPIQKRDRTMKMKWKWCSIDFRTNDTFKKPKTYEFPSHSDRPINWMSTSNFYRWVSPIAHCKISWVNASLQAYISILMQKSIESIPSSHRLREAGRRSGYFVTSLCAVIFVIAKATLASSRPSYLRMKAQRTQLITFRHWIQVMHLSFNSPKKFATKKKQRSLRKFKFSRRMHALHKRKFVWFHFMREHRSLESCILHIPFFHFHI